jgi:hypothetical protein
MGSAHYLRVEGVNLYDALFDTNQLSVIRGGSLLLKHAVETLADQFQGRLQALSTGASSGLFRVEQFEPSLLDAIVSHLRKSYPHFTFVTAICPMERDFREAKEILLARCRFQQMSQLSLAPDPLTDQSQSPCKLEGIRIGARSYRLPGDAEEHGKKPVSSACLFRLKYGRWARSQLYTRELEALAGTAKPGDSDGDSQASKIRSLIPKIVNPIAWTHDFEDIAVDKVYGNLSGKMAVIYFDGNGFGQIQQDLVASPEDQRTFDGQIQQRRREFLYTLVEHFENKRGEAGKIRLETLLWGGDEMLFVVPAWHGFELVNLLFAQDWTIRLEGQERTLTHAGGLVFCSYKTPIGRITQLARSLAERVKDSEDGRGRKENRYDCLVLESIDYPAESLGEYFEKRYGQFLAQHRRPFPAPDRKSSSSLAPLLAGLPRAQIYGLAVAAKKLTAQNGLLEGYEDWAKLQGRLRDLYGSENWWPDLSRCLDPLLLPAGSTPDAIAADTASEQAARLAWRWIHLSELWDYLAPAVGETAP